MSPWVVWSVATAVAFVMAPVSHPGHAPFTVLIGSRSRTFRCRAAGAMPGWGTPIATPCPRPPTRKQGDAMVSREKQLKRLRKDAQRLWSDQQELLNRANGVARTAWP